jgi:hypothetical protein
MKLEKHKDSITLTIYDGQEQPSTVLDKIVSRCILRLRPSTTYLIIELNRSFRLGKETSYYDGWHTMLYAGWLHVAIGN